MTAHLPASESYPNAGSIELLPRGRFLMVRDLVFRVHGKYSEIGKGVFSVETVALKIHIELGAVREPKLKLTCGRFNEAIFNALVIQAKANPGDGLHQVRIQSRHLIRARKNPSPAPQVHIVRCSVYSKRISLIGAIRTLLKPDLPRRQSMPFPQTFALHFEIAGVSRVKD